MKITSITEIKLIFYRNDTFMQYVDLGLAQINGFDFLANYSGCSRPCYRMIYKTKEYFSSPLKFTYNPEMKKPFPSKNNETQSKEGTLLIINHVKQSTYSKHQEKYYYDGQSYISDVGGISGIFLGFSFWSFYELLIQPFIRKIKKLF